MKSCLLPIQMVYPWNLFGFCRNYELRITNYELRMGNTSTSLSNRVMGGCGLNIVMATAITVETFLGISLLGKRFSLRPLRLLRYPYPFFCHHLKMKTD